jgi:hypothetical protein
MAAMVGMKARHKYQSVGSGSGGAFFQMVHEMCVAILATLLRE